MIDRDWIVANIPHQSEMCLLDAVIEWNDVSIVCLARSHRSASNPLAIDGVLSSVAGIEYAAQAIAVHGALLSNEKKIADAKAPPKAGYLTSVRDVKWHIERIDNLADNLTVYAERIAGNETTLLYRFEVSAQKKIVLTGRASILIDADSLQPNASNQGMNES